jgi:hypothetical protein
VLERPLSGSSEGPKSPLGCQVLESSGRDNLENRHPIPPKQSVRAPLRHLLGTPKNGRGPGSRETKKYKKQICRGARKKTWPEPTSVRLGAALLAAPNGGAGLHREQIKLGSPDLIPAQCAALEPLRDEVHYDAVFTVTFLPI